jgi:hypothetical protein
MVSTHDTDIVQPRQNSIPSKLELIIRNQFPGFELVSPVHVGLDATCYQLPDQRVDVGSTTQICFNIGSKQFGHNVALMYKLQRKNENAIFSEEEIYTKFVVAWKLHGFRITSYLIEHDKSYVWNSYKLMGLIECCKLYDIQHGRIEETYLMRDNAVLMTSLNIICEEECYKLEIIISEGSINDNTQRPKYIGLGG